ncbi:MAG TPA: GAF domain-containing protein, partial [Armatimonadota bacterium]|nr:GAF domain-containing protein [Armatimonadota bacterium]
MTPDITQQPREFHIPARLQEISVVRRAVSECARQACLGVNETNDLILAVSEACANAIQHGTDQNENADISIRIFTTAGVVGVEIHDPGSGFDPAGLWTPSGQICGHGIMLILHLSDTVHYTCGNFGTTVSITKYSGNRDRCAPHPLNEGISGLDMDARHSSRIAYLFDVCRAVSGTLDLSKVLHLVTERTARYFGVPSARVLLHDTRHQTATLAASWGEEFAKAPAGKVGQPRIPRSSLSVPIISRDKVVGSIHLDSRQPAQSFTHADVAALRAIAAQAAVAIENARLYRESQTRVEQLAALGEVACGLNASLDLDHTLHTILDKTRELLGVDLCAVMLLDGDGYLSVRAAHGMSEEYINCQRALLQESPLARALKEKRVIAAWDLRPYDAPRGRYEGVVSAAAAPMLLNAVPIGVLNIYTRERYQFTKDQLRVLRALADYA